MIEKGLKLQLKVLKSKNIAKHLLGKSVRLVVNNTKHIQKSYKQLKGIDGENTITAVKGKTVNW